MGVSANLLFNRSYHKIPRKLEVHLKITGAADVNADGYTINFGSDLIATVAKNGEGVIDITTKFPFKELVHVSSNCSLATVDVDWTSTTVASQLVKLTARDKSDATSNGAAVDPDSGVIHVYMVFNTSQTGTK